ncbi:hypothetical protein KAF25_002551 [Fusarium avenaceum]|uniref:Enoyl reductase (ER) domain-containing protein n=1 Tax=Fusarium avenaceum TaxID=40199 RepID=A0A9P7H327_9HYPO|nr:hypothetical protein KAF25_002551 [Fusarium avenaceum]
MAVQSILSRLPATQTSLKVQGAATVALQDGCPIEPPKEDEVLVRIFCVGVNPHDWKSLDMSPSPGSTWGCDFAGEVVIAGSQTTKYRPGDRVGGACAGNRSDNPNNGGFAQFVSVPEMLLLRLPSWMSFEQGATLGVGLLTVGLSLYHTMKLPLPYSGQTTDQYILIYGGGTATGGLAIQAAKLSGLKPITTCSPGKFEHVKSLGAVEAFDYRSPSCASEIRAFTNDNLEYVLDCITESSSMKICYGAIGSHGGNYIGLDQFPIRGHTRRDVRPGWVLAWTALGKPVDWKKPYRREARPKDKAFAEAWAPIAQRLLDSKDIATHPTEVSDEGLAGVAKGAERVKMGTAGGKKLIYRVATPSA